MRYIDVKKEAGGLDRMLEYSGGLRHVPVVVQDGEVAIGHNGGY